MVMKKFLNDPQRATNELLEGYALCFPDKVKLVSEKIVVRATPKAKDKVAVITLGGSGHEPALSGFVGEGMLDASVVGDIFAAPGAPKVLEALRIFKDNAGIVFLVLNHEGDQRNANMAMTMAEKEGIKVAKIVTAEDIAPGVDAPISERRGLGGCIPLLKIIGAAAEKGFSAEEIVEIGERFNKRMATLAVTLKVATHPQSGGEIGELADDQMEIGMGQHGEGGGNGPEPMQSADWIAETMMNKVLRAIEAKSGEKILLLINGSGGTTLMEQFIIFRKAHEVATAAGVEVVESYCGEVLTVQEASGFQMIVGVYDDQTFELFNAPCDTPYWVTR
jgi:dihydroxyacetone kinase-like protein